MYVAYYLAIIDIVSSLRFSLLLPYCHDLNLSFSEGAIHIELLMTAGVVSDAIGTWASLLCGL